MMDNNLIIGSKIIKLKSIKSTNDYLRELKNLESLNDGFTVIAAQQTNGKGYHKNKWESEPNKNILLSIVVFPEFLLAQDQFLLSKIVSLAVLDYLKLYSSKFIIKWPNDIYYKDLKVAGILIENSVKGEHLSDSIIGIGINVNQENFSRELINPVSINNITNTIYIIDIEAYKLLDTLNFRYKQLIDENFTTINNDYLSNLYRLNKWALFKDDKTEFKGKITGVNKFGFLEVLSESGKLKTYNFKEIEFVL